MADDTTRPRGTPPDSNPLPRSGVCRCPVFPAHGGSYRPFWPSCPFHGLGGTPGQESLAVTCGLIDDYTERHGVPPGWRDLTAARGFRSTNAIANQVSKLRNLGLVDRRDFRGSRQLRVMPMAARRR